MKLSKLIKLAQQAKKQFGDIQVCFDASSMNTELSWNYGNGEEEWFTEEYCVFDMQTQGVFVLYEEDFVNHKKAFVLGVKSKDTFFKKDFNLLKTKRSSK